MLPGHLWLSLFHPFCVKGLQKVCGKWWLWNYAWLSKCFCSKTNSHSNSVSTRVFSITYIFMKQDLDVSTLVSRNIHIIMHLRKLYHGNSCLQWFSGPLFENSQVIFPALIIQTVSENKTDLVWQKRGQTRPKRTKTTYDLLGVTQVLALSPLNLNFSITSMITECPADISGHLPGWLDLWYVALKWCQSLCPNIGKIIQKEKKQSWIINNLLTSY